MRIMKPIQLFLHQNVKKLKRKWRSLPLLLLFPIIVMGLLALITISFLQQDSHETIQVGLVDEDQSNETQLAVKLIEESDQLGRYINLKSMTKTEAAHQLQTNQLSGYITFPDAFTQNLYSGHPVKLPITGNPNKQTDSFMLKEILDSVSRHIRAAQANILTINQYAKQLPMNDKERSTLLNEQFTSFLMYTISKDKIIQEDTVTNDATRSPRDYYTLASWFSMITIWLMTFYLFFTDRSEHRMAKRMQLYGVKPIHQRLAKMISAFIVTTLLALCCMPILQHVLNIDLDYEDYKRIAVLIGLYNLIFLEGLVIIETLIRGQKIQLLIQTCFTFVTLFLSGTIMPVLYFPKSIQGVLPYSFATQAYKWLNEIVLNKRLYADYIPLIIMLGIGFLIFLALSYLKERVES